MIDRFDKSFSKCSCWVFNIFYKTDPYLLRIWPFQAKHFIFASHEKTQNGKFVYHGFKIIYKRFKSSSTKTDRICA